MFGIQSILGAYCLTGLKITSCDSIDPLFWNCHYFLEQPLCTAANMPWVLLLHITVILLCQGRIQPHRAGVSLCWPHATVQHVQIWEKPKGSSAYSSSFSLTSMEPSLSSETVCCICVCIQCNPYHATNGIFKRTRTNNFTIYMEIYPIQNKKFKVWGKKT